MSKRSYPVWDYPSNTKQNLITPAKSPQERNRGVGIPQSQQSRAPTLQNTTPAQRGIVPERGQNARQNYKPPTRGRPASTGAQPWLRNSGAGKQTPGTTGTIRRTGTTGTARQTGTSKSTGTTGKPPYRSSYASAADLADMNEIMGVNSYTGEAQDVADDFLRQKGVSSTTEYQKKFFAEQEAKRRAQEERARQYRELYGSAEDEAEILGLRGGYTGKVNDMVQAEWARYNVDNAADYRAALEAKGTGADYLWRRAVGGAKGATQALANDISYRSQLAMPYQAAEQAYWEDVYNGGAASRAAREERYAGLTENQRTALEYMGSLDASSEYLLQAQREAEAKYADEPLYRAAYWADEYNAETQRKYGDVSDGLRLAGKFAERLGSRVPAIAAKYIPIFGPFLSNAMLYGQSSGAAFDRSLSEGATRHEAELYASGIGMKAVVTERLSDGMNKLFGKGFSDKLTNQVVDKLAKSPAGKIVLRFLLNANNEGLENVIDDVLDPLFTTIYKGKQYSSAQEYFSDVDVAQLTEDYLIGFGESLLYQSGGVLAEKSRKPTDPIYAVLLDKAQEKVEEKLGSDEYQRVIQGLNGDGGARAPEMPTNDWYNDVVLRAAQNAGAGGGNARRLGIDPAFDQKVMTALMSDDIIDPSTGKYVLYGSYGDLNKFRKLEGITGVQLHHLNQQGVFGETIPYRDGVCIMLRGNAITEKGSEHNLLHIWTEGFFNNYRAGGEYEGELPTIGEYNIENAKSIGNAGFGNDLVEAFINASVQEQFDYGFSMDELIPRLPGSMHLK